MKTHELLHDGQSQAEAAVIARECGVGLAETVKNVCEELGFDAHPRILYDNMEIRSDSLDYNLYGAALGGKFNRIGKEVPDYLLKPIIVP